MPTPTVDRLSLHVSELDNPADDVLELSFTDPSGTDLPPWEPGAHIEMHLPSGLSRQYSLCGDPSDRTKYVVAVLREKDGRGGSRELHEIAQKGLEVSIRAPKNDFPLEDGESYLFIGGGIGITPLIPMVREVAARDATWSLVYGGRSASSMAYREHVKELGDQVDLWEEDERGYPDLPALLASVPNGTLVYTCGPGALIDAVAAEHAKHERLGTLHFERFAASGPIDTTGNAIEVELHRSGKTIAVPEDVPILEAIRAVLADQPFSCEEGYCGECETRVLEGVPDHRDDYLTAEEQEDNDRMMICVSRCVGTRLVLDL